MNILSYFTNSGVPETGLSPTIRIRNVSTGALVITDAAMAEVGDGFYRYDFTGYDATVDYSIRSDGGVSLADAERYAYAGNESYFDDIAQSTWTANLSAYIPGPNAAAAMVNLLYGDYIVVDETSQWSGTTTFALGTKARPINNIGDAVTIANNRMIKRLMLLSSATVEADDNISQLSIETLGTMDIDVTLTAGCSADGAHFQNLNLEGELTNGDVILVDDCSIGNFEGFSGIMNVVAFTQGSEISIGTWANILEGVAGGEPTNEPEISINSSMLTIAKYTGNLKIMNKTGANRTTIELEGGNIIFDATCVAGTIQLLGHGFIEADNSGAGCNIDLEGFLSRGTISESSADAVWDETLIDHTIAGTYGAEVATKADIVASTSTIFTPATSGSVIQGTETSGTWQSTVNRDNIYWNITEDTLTGITVELIFNIPELDRPGILSLFGRYEGQPAGEHYIELWAWNYEATAWEQLVDVFIPGGSLADAEQVHEYYERNVDRTSNNEVKFRLVHHITNYVGSHNMYIDTVYITSIAVITAEDIANAVWSKTLSGGYTAEYVLLDNNESLKRALGLMHENIYIDQPGYDINANLISARVRIYSDSASVGTANNVIGTYQITSDGTGRGQFANWRQVRTG